MRKFSKVLTVLLTLALLCGIFVSAAAATGGESTWTPKITEDSRNRYNDFDGLTGNYWNNYRPNFASTSEVEGADGNHYAQITFPQSAITETQYAADTLYKQNSNVQAGWQLGTHSKPSASLIGYDYVVFDFDFGTDKYVHTYKEDVTYKDANGEEKTESVTKYEYVDAIPEGISDAEKANYKLGYIGGFYNYLRLYEYDSTAGTDGTYVSANSGASAVQIGQKDGIWYVSADGTFGSPDDIPLSNQIGVFDHFTFVHQSIYAADGTFTGIKVYVYVNGELLKSVNVSATSTKKNDAGEVIATSNDIRLEKLTLTYYYYMANCLKYYPTYEEFSVHAKEFGSTASVCLDNLSLNWYKSDDAKADALDAFYADTPTAPIYNCDNVVYTDAYKSPNPGRYATVNGTKYSIINEAFRALSGDGTITINESVENYKLPKFFTGLKVVAENGAKFSLEPVSAADYNVTETVDGDTTTYTIKIDGMPSTDGWLNITGDSHNHANAYGTTGGGANNGNRTATNKWNGVTTGYAQIADGDYFKGVASGITGGVFSVHRNPSADLSTNANYAKADLQMYWYMSPYRPSPVGWMDGDITNYDYVIADFDFGTNRYAYTTADGVTATGTTVPEGATNVKPAYSAGMMVGVSYAGFTGDPAVSASGTFSSSSTEGRYASKFWIQIVYNSENGRYYASANSTYDESDVPLSGQVGEFDHVTFVFDPANRKIVGFVNGQYVNEVTYSSSWVVTNFVATAIALPGTGVKLEDQVSMAIDNNAVNWYKNAADTKTGIDAFMKGDYKNGKLYDCDDVLYSKNYYIPHSSYATVDGEVVFMSPVVYDKISSLRNNGNVTSPVDLLGINPTADVIYVQLTGNAKTVTLSPEADMYIIEDQGDGLYKVRKLAEEDLVEVSVVDREDKVVDTFYLAPNKELLIPAIDLDEFDVATRKVYTLNGWYITVDGVESAAAGYKYSDITKVSKELKVYPKFDEDQVAETYAIYTVKADGTKKLVGTPADYASMANFQSKVKAATSGMTVVLLYDLNTPYDINAATKSQITLEISSGQNVSLDLNGRTLVHSYGGTSAYGGYMFKVYNTATFNLYSSVPGGAIYQARPHTDRGNSSYGQVCAPGIIYTEGTSEVTINIDGAVDPAYKNNFSLYGGTLYFNAASERTANNVVNVNGGFYFAPTRSGSSIFTNQNGGGNYYNLTDATFYVLHPSAYGIFHDYTGANYPKAGSHVVADGCTFVAYNTNKNAPGALFYGSDATSTAKFTDCIIVGSIGGSIQVEIGEGCIVAGSTTGSRAKLADGVSKTASDLNYSITMFDHPALPFYDVTELNKDGTENTNYSAENDPIIKDAETGKYYLNPKIYDKNNWVDGETLYFSSAYMTYSSDESAPEYDVVKGLDKDGNTLVSAKWIKSSVAVKAPSSSFNKDMYKVSGATWNATEDKFTFVLADYSVVGNFQGMLTNATLSTGMTYNIYIPADAGVTVTGVEGGTLAEKLYSYNGKSYYHVAVDLAAAEFATTVTVSFSVPSIAGEGNKAGSQVLSADIVAYANKVVSSGFYAHESDEANLVYTMVAYKNEVAKYLGGESYVQPESVTKFFTEAHKDCTCGSVEIYYPADYGFEYDTAADLEDVGITGATFSIEGTNFLSFILEGDAGLEVNVSYDTPVGTVNLTAEYNEEMGCYVVPGVTAAHIDEVFTITVDGVSAVYSLASYIENAEENVLPLVEALARYAAAAEDYKYVTVDEVE